MDSALWNWTAGDVVSVHNSSEMDTMISVWTMVEHVRVASGAAELAIFTAILYWFFTSRCVLYSSSLTSDFRECFPKLSVYVELTIVLSLTPVV